MGKQQFGWERVALGRSGLVVSRLGIGAAYGIGARDVAYAFDCGINLFYWGSLRRRGFGRAIRDLARTHREEMVVVVQTYSRLGLGVGPSLELALRTLATEYADVLLLGLWNQPPPARILDAALTLREAGKVRAVMISCHHRPTFARFIDDPCYDAIMVRYSAAHRGAEREVFARLPAERPARPGLVAYTATRWGQLLDPARMPAGEPTPRGADCYRFALTNPDVDTCLVGPRDRGELDEALLALDRGPMDDDELAWMRRVGDAVRARARSERRFRAPLALIRRVARRSRTRS